MRVAVTGATGHLGRVLVPYLASHGHAVTVVGRELGSPACDVLVHLAAPNHRDASAVNRFLRYVADIDQWASMTHTRVVSCGSWWQYAGGEASTRDYARMKATQQSWLGSFGPVLIPFSIYGDETRDGRGFIPQLVAARTGGPPLTEASRQRRSWVHVVDVARAFEQALAYPKRGAFELAGDRELSPSALALACGLSLPEYQDDPSALIEHRHPRLPGWHPTVDVLDHVRSLIREAA